MTDGPLAASAFANRLLKNARHLERWARREDISAWRVYDRDIPEFPYAVDLYGDRLHVQLFEGKRALDDATVAEHMSAVASALDTDRAAITLKTRRRQRGSAQYEKLDVAAESFTVAERGLLFEVNLGRYLDTGLFLDHRETRQRVRLAAADKRVLNLFAYTGSFTVYAASGAARSTVTIDLSKTYQDWTWRNLTLNGFDDRKRHKMIAADATEWLLAAQGGGDKFDLIVLDPPSFSNSKRMRASFDVQRDHATLIQLAMKLLAPRGMLYFSNNRHGFRMDTELEQQWRISELTRQTMTEDFRRRPQHRCWLLQAR